MKNNYRQNNSFDYSDSQAPIDMAKNIEIDVEESGDISDDWSVKFQSYNLEEIGDLLKRDDLFSYAFVSTRVLSVTYR